MHYIDKLYQAGHMDETAAGKLKFEGDKIPDKCKLGHMCPGGFTDCPKLCSKYKREQ